MAAETVAVTVYQTKVFASVWGSITGTLANQADLVAALGAKAAAADVTALASALNNKSAGGNGEDDSGKYVVFGEGGRLISTGGMAIFRTGSTNVVFLDPAALTGERSQAFTDGSGILGLRVVDVPANSSAGGRPGMWADDGSYLYICTANDTWRRTALSAF